IELELHRGCAIEVAKPGGEHLGDLLHVQRLQDLAQPVGRPRRGVLERALGPRRSRQLRVAPFELLVRRADVLEIDCHSRGPLAQRVALEPREGPARAGAPRAVAALQAHADQREALAARREDLALAMRDDVEARSEGTEELVAIELEPHQLAAIAAPKVRWE